MSDLPRRDQLPPGPDALRKRTVWSVKREIPKLWHWGELGKLKVRRATHFAVIEIGEQVGHTIKLASGETVRIVKAKRARVPSLEERQAALEAKMAELARLLRQA